MSSNDSITPADTRIKIQQQFMIIERYRDFVGWLFENHNDEGIDWMTEGEAWDMFDEWEQKEYTPANP